MLNLTATEGIDSLGVGSINEVTARLVERVKELEAALLVHLPEPEFPPLVADAHPTEADGRDMQTSEWGELAVTAKFCLRSRRRCEGHCAIGRGARVRASLEGW